MTNSFDPQTDPEPTKNIPGDGDGVAKMGYYLVTVRIVRAHYVTAEDEQAARVRALSLLGINDKTPGDISITVARAEGL